jgi:hypothetical protein
MKIPGFTAEASLFKTTSCYQLVEAWKDRPSDKSLVPQIGWLDTGAVMEAAGCEQICTPSPYGVGKDCFWFCPWMEKILLTEKW